MGTAFKTSSGSKKFGKEMQNTFEMLEAATSRLKHVSGENLILSPEESKIVEETTKKIEELKNTISTIKSGKIGKIFEDSTKDEFEEVRKVAEKFSLNL